MDKLKMHSPDLTQENIKKIQALFPNCVTEARDDNGILRLAIDFDQLKQELSDSIVEGPQERYHLNWPGKREALLQGNTATKSTLLPSFSESVNFETTENIFVEGDNLEVLKLLQESYLSKVKLIYIDPPYNTGKDFIYKDSFASESKEYMLDSNQVDQIGRKLVANSEANGRFHSDWLSMIYPRLKLARNLLRDDGVIFVSIDDHESENLKKICDEVFGQSNFIATLVWNKQHSQQQGLFKRYHEYIHVYAKNVQLHSNIIGGEGQIVAGALKRSQKPTQQANSHSLQVLDVKLQMEHHLPEYMEIQRR